MNTADPIRIPVPPHFSFSECLWFLDRNFDDCMHSVAAGGVFKALEVGGGPVMLHISYDNGALLAAIQQGRIKKSDRDAITGWIREWFDLDRDISPFYELLRHDEKLAPMADRYAGLRLVGIPDLFEALCWSIIGQQINLPFAYKLKRRLVERYGRALTCGNRICYLFPSPEALAGAEIAALRAMQFAGKKAEYLTGLAAVFRDGQLSKKQLREIPSFAGRRQALTALRGIGTWTANYALMKSMRDMEAIPYGDAGLLQALTAKGLIRDRKDLYGIDELFGRFAGWESYLVFYLWRSLSEPAVRL